MDRSADGARSTARAAVRSSGVGWVCGTGPVPEPAAGDGRATGAECSRTAVFIIHFRVQQCRSGARGRSCAGIFTGGMKVSPNGGENFSHTVTAGGLVFWPWKMRSTGRASLHLCGKWLGRKVGGFFGACQRDRWDNFAGVQCVSGTKEC